jgi:hypothetical protein
MSDKKDVGNTEKGTVVIHFTPSFNILLSAAIASSGRFISIFN